MRTTKSLAGILAVILFSACLPASGQLLPEVSEKTKKAPSPKPSQILIVTNPAAQVYLDDAFKGQASPQGRLVIENPKPGDHTLRISLSGKSDYEKQVRVVAGQVSRVDATLVDAETRTGSTDVNRIDGLKYSWIPPGTFQMGCSPGDAECYESEKPGHPVTLTRGFWIGQTDVTVGAYKKYVAAAGGSMPEYQKSDEHPVVNVNYDDSVAYCGWAGGRLPSEAEWEYAARGGSTANRYAPLDSTAWYDQNSGNEWHAVAQKRPNGFGLFDTLGNVWQWVDSWWDSEYYKTSPTVDPPGLSSSQVRVLRGGSYFNAAIYSRVSERNNSDPAKRNITFGMRCVMDSTPSRATTVVAHITTPTKRTINESTPTETSTATSQVNRVDELRYLWIPNGTFLMGCSDTDTQCYASETPQHQVTLSKGFWIGQTDVTVAAFKKYAASAGIEVPANQKDDNYPVVNVSWNDMAAYCGWAGGRLPSEAEWEYAARGGSTDIRYGPLDSIGWYNQNSGNEWHPVAQKLPNGFGLYDMIGGVWQWVDSFWDMDYYKSSPAIDPPGLASGQNRVMRGGSWFNEAVYSRVSMRNYGDPTVPNTTFGGRCVTDVAPTKVVSGKTHITTTTTPTTTTKTPEETSTAMTTRINPKDGLKYTFIPSGTFQMGCSTTDTQCVSSEFPQHEITLTKGFWIGQTDVTVAAYKKFTDATGAQTPGYQKGDQFPIVNVSWNDGVAYCRWAGGRLPTEAEWEYAARGGNSDIRYGPLDSIGWYDLNSDKGWHEVAQKLPNAFGLYDMVGNVWQWVDSWYDKDYYKTSPKADPPGMATGQYRVMRGGSWFNGAEYSRASARNWGDPVTPNTTFGIRCAADSIGR